jgi:hypothetical protein
MFSCRCLFSSPMLRKQPNARGEPRLEAGAQRTLEGVGSTAKLGAGWVREVRTAPCTSLACLTGLGSPPLIACGRALSLPESAYPRPSSLS